jgi:hypothetical protein
LLALPFLLLASSVLFLLPLSFFILEVALNAKALLLKSALLCLMFQAAPTDLLHLPISLLLLLDLQGLLLAASQLLLEPAVLLGLS